MLPPLAISKVNLLVCMAYKLSRRGNLKFWTMPHQTFLYTPMERSMIKPVDLTGLSVRSLVNGESAESTADPPNNIKPLWAG